MVTANDLTFDTGIPRMASRPKYIRPMANAVVSAVLARSSGYHCEGLVG
jgi:hypothetical protein